MEREDEAQFETGTVQQEAQAEETHGRPQHRERPGSDGEALARHEI